jgi:hypothetical protein
LTLSPPREISRTEVNQLALPYRRMLEVAPIENLL